MMKLHIIETFVPLPTDIKHAGTSKTARSTGNEANLNIVYQISFSKITQDFRRFKFRLRFPLSLF